MNQDIQNLGTLSLVHYIFAGVLALLSLVQFIIFMTIIKKVGIEGSLELNSVTSLMVSLPVFFSIAGIVIAALIAAAGSFLSRQTGYGFCIFVAVIECLNMPLGTILGVFTIIVLSRDSVKELFADKALQ